MPHRAATPPRTSRSCSTFTIDGSLARWEQPETIIQGTERDARKQLRKTWHQFASLAVGIRDAFINIGGSQGYAHSQYGNRILFFGWSNETEDPS